MVSWDDKGWGKIEEKWLGGMEGGSRVTHLLQISENKRMRKGRERERWDGEVERRQKGDGRRRDYMEEEGET